MLAPFMDWAPRVNGDALRADLGAAAVGAIVVLPQGLAFAALAGMPPIHGIYVSIIPVIVAALWGSSWHTVSGPNAGIAVIVGATVAPLALAGSSDYIGLAYVLALMVGVTQFAIGMLRLGAVLDFISNTVVAAVIMAIAVVLVVAAGRSLTEIPGVGGQTVLMQYVDLARNLPAANPNSVIVGMVTIGAGFGAKRFFPKYSLLAAVAAGWACAGLMGLVLGPEGFAVARVGSFDMQAFAFVIPWHAVDATADQVLAMAPGAFAIAILGMAQTVMMSRSTAKKSGQLIDTNQEIVGQGLSNVSAAFLSAFAGSGSFNRTAANYQCGARTPLAAGFSSVILLLLLLLAADAVAMIPAAAIGGTLFVVGVGLMDFKALRGYARSRPELLAWTATFGIAMAVGFNEAIGAGILVSLVNYLWRASKPNVRLEEHYSRDGRLVTVATLDGNLFFGAVQYVERILSGAGLRAEPGIFLIRTDHLTYMDVPGAELIAEEAKRRRDRGDEVYVYVSRRDILEALHLAGVPAALGPGRLIRKHRDHPARDLLYPYRAPSKMRAEPAPSRPTDPAGLAVALRRMKMFSPIPEDRLRAMLEKAGLQAASAGEGLAGGGESINRHVLLLDGALEVTRSWVTLDGVDKASSRLVEAGAEPAVIAACPRGLALRAASDLRYVLLDAAMLDDIAGRQAAAGEGAGTPGLARSGIMGELPPEQLHRVMEAMAPVEIEAGEPVVRQGDPGTDYYLIEEGYAEVWREDALSGESTRLASLGPGDTFGEESLLQGGYRNATVRMTTPGRLMKLAKADFDRLLKEPLTPEISPAEARALLDRGEALLLDCRYDMEIAQSRIPGARALPLDQIRAHGHLVGAGRTCLVYCRDGRRSRVAAFLLKERGVNAMSIAGGIAAWPYDLDLSPLEDIAEMAV